MFSRMARRKKNLETVQNILEFLALHNITRTDFLVAVGGGVVGDITGFCAAIYLRGIRFFQFPTTFLAAIDSSVGGKTGVNLDAGKNLAGAFWQPEMVICDCNTFSTLPYDVFSDGTAEAIKYGVIADKDLFSMLSSGSLSENLIDVIECCVKIKSELVSCDEFDRGRRLLLNFGHTIAHAIEKCSNFSIPHGRAVGIGMALISKAAYQLGFSNVDCAKPISEALHKYSLPDASPFEKQALLHAIGYDKKRSGDEITLVLPVRIGECCYEKFSLKELPPIFRCGFF